jgi:hypothetical protein
MVERQRRVASDAVRPEDHGAGREFPAGAAVAEEWGPNLSLKISDPPPPNHSPLPRPRCWLSPRQVLCVECPHQKFLSESLFAAECFNSSRGLSHRGLNVAMAH